RKSGAAEHSRKSSLKNLIIAQEAGTARGSKLPLQFLPDTSDAERGNDQQPNRRQKKAAKTGSKNFKNTRCIGLSIDAG
ncbi:hypothetical protein, partial [Pseudomonas sp. Irchel s3f10]|uniref:hypothetical protein n=1 Tax=Pseudomonas sp. Irchel s3f10 TaxID=2009137 RepID=UPI001C48CA46